MNQRERNPLTPRVGVPVQQLGGHIGKIFEKKDVVSLQPTESETAELKDHVIIMGFGRVGQTIAQLLSERLIPYVALDVRADRVLAGKAADLPIYFGDAGSPAVLEHVGAARARCAVITLNTPGANYRSVWAVNKNFPHVQIFVRAHDVEHGLNLEKAGATAGAGLLPCAVCCDGGSVLSTRLCDVGFAAEKRLSPGGPGAVCSCSTISARARRRCEFMRHLCMVYCWVMYVRMPRCFSAQG